MALWNKLKEPLALNTKFMVFRPNMHWFLKTYSTKIYISSEVGNNRVVTTRLCQFRSGVINNTYFWFRSGDGVCSRVWLTVATWDGLTEKDSLGWEAARPEMLPAWPSCGAGAALTTSLSGEPGREPGSPFLVGVLASFLGNWSFLTSRRSGVTHSSRRLLTREQQVQRSTLQTHMRYDTVVTGVRTELIYSQSI